MRFFLDITTEWLRRLLFTAGQSIERGWMLVRRIANQGQRGILRRVSETLPILITFVS